MKVPPLESYGSSDIGLVRTNNEDIWERAPEYGFFALADGMGGHKAGEVASKQAIQFLTYSIEELLLAREKTWDQDDMSGFMKLLYENTNSWVYNYSRKKEQLRGMGTTLCSILFFDDAVIVGNVGDSRVYLKRDDALSQLTIDHSMENVLLSEGKPEEVAVMSKNILTMAVGTSIEVEPQIEVVTPLPGDVYLLCSDGLSDYVADSQILQCMEESESLSESGKNLIEKAKASGSSDNITVVLVRLLNEREKKADLFRQ